MHELQQSAAERATAAATCENKRACSGMPARKLRYARRLSRGFRREPNPRVGPAETSARGMPRACALVSAHSAILTSDGAQLLRSIGRMLRVDFHLRAKEIKGPLCECAAGRSTVSRKPFCRQQRVVGYTMGTRVVMGCKSVQDTLTTCTYVQQPRNRT